MQHHEQGREEQEICMILNHGMKHKTWPKKPINLTESFFVHPSSWASDFLVRNYLHSNDASLNAIREDSLHSSIVAFDIEFLQFETRERALEPVMM
jgi:hypothetical protein